jgi:7,8-dihydroneopterin aldolase/epimerase/oxygenase
MSEKSGRVSITNMRFWGKHGVTELERASTQPIDVDIEVSADLSLSSTSDRLSDTVDYVMLCELCERSVAERSFALLESLASYIAQKVLENPKILEVTVRVRKPRLLDGATPQVEIRLRRKESQGRLAETDEAMGDGGK